MSRYRTPSYRCLEVTRLVGGLATIIALGAGCHAMALAAAGPSSPEAVPGLLLWYRADAISGVKDGDVVERWNDGGPQRVPLQKHGGAPSFVSKAINGLPGVRFRAQEPDSFRTPSTLPGLAGNPGFTVFIVANVARPKTQYAQPLGWGEPSRPGGGLFLEFEAGRVDLGTGFAADATTADESYAAHFGKPAIVTCVKSPGPVNRTTRIAYNGVWQAVSGNNVVPRVKSTALHVGGSAQPGYISPAMDLAEIVLFNRPLTLREQDSVGHYLQQKYAIAGRFVAPDRLLVRELELRILPAEVAPLAGFAGKQEHDPGSTCEAAVESRVILHTDTGARGFVFDHWDGDVTDPKSAKTTVRLDRSKTITAVYREQKREFFIATNGRDTWSGTLPEPNAAGTDGPLASLTGARNAIRKLKTQFGGQLPCSVRVFLRGGRYTLAEPFVLGPEDSGTPDFQVTYTSLPGESPVLSGGRVITGWKPYKDKILQCSVPGAKGGSWKFRQLFYNGKDQIRARTPDFDPKDPLKGGWASMEGPAQPGSQTAFRYKQGTFPRRWAKPTQAEVNLYIGFDWDNNIIPIKSIDPQNRMITLAHSTTQFTNPPSPLPFNFPTPFNPNQRFIVENVLEELDQPGEWCWDSDEGTLYFWPPDAAIAKAQVVAPVLHELIVLRGAAHVTVSGLTFAETNGGDNFHPEGVEGVGAMFAMPGWKYCGDAVLLDGAQHCRIQHNRFVNIGGNAIYLKGPCARNQIQRNDISEVGACGVSLTGVEAKEAYPVFNEVVDNRIRNIGTMNWYSAGVFLGLSEGNVVGHNSIRHVPHHAINLGNTGRSHNIVEYNEIRDTCLRISDTGAINCWMEHDARNEPRQGHIIRYNLVADSRERGIYLDNYTSNCFVYGNIVVRAPLYALIVHGGKNNVIENNIFIGASQAVALYDGIDGLMPRMTNFFGGNRLCRNIICDAAEAAYVAVKRPERALAQSDYNLLFNVADGPIYLESRRKEGHETHSRIADPMFVDPAKDDYRLKPESPAIQLGFQPIDVGQIGVRGGVLAQQRQSAKP